MILDFLKKYSRIFYIIFGINLASILFVTKYYLHVSIISHSLTFLITTLFWCLLWIVSHKIHKSENIRCSNRTEGNILLAFAFSTYATIIFFSDSTEKLYFGEAPFFFLSDIFCTIFFAKKYNIQGCWFKKDNEEDTE